MMLEIGVGTHVKILNDVNTIDRTHEQRGSSEENGN